MRLVFIYGPPASGKLTVARELSKLTGFRLFHNHVSIQFVESLFEFETRPFQQLVDKYRLDAGGGSQTSNRHYLHLRLQQE